MHEMPIRTVHLDQVRGRPNQATQVRKTSAIHVSPSIQHRPSDLNGYFDHLTACELEHLDRPQIVLVRTNHEQSPDQSSKLPKGVFPSGPSPDPPSGPSQSTVWITTRCHASTLPQSSNRTADPDPRKCTAQILLSLYHWQLCHPDHAPEHSPDRAPGTVRFLFLLLFTSKLHHHCSHVLNTKCTSPCACVLAFS